MQAHFVRMRGLTPFAFFLSEVAEEALLMMK